MRKLLLLIVTLSLGTFALAQMGNSSSDAQGAGNDWYNQHLSAQVQEFTRIAAARAPSAISESQSGALPASMAANAGQGASDWYNQVLAANVQEFDRINAAIAPSAASQPAQ